MSVPLILASGSATRAALLRAAGLAPDIERPQIDEDEAADALIADGLGPRDLADALGELKCLRVARRNTHAIVIGADQTLDLDGVLIRKARDRDEAARTLRVLSGRTHHLHSAAVAARNGAIVWRHVGRATLRVRPLSEDFIAAYLDAEGDSILGSVGCYRIEGRGVQLFERIDGDHFTILGLPLLPLLAFLRTQGAIAS